VSHGVASATVASVSVPEVCAPTNKKFPKLFSFVVALLSSLREAAGQKHREQRAHEKRSQRASSAVFASETLSRRRRSPRDFVSHRRHHFFNLSLKNQGGLNTRRRGFLHPRAFANGLYAQKKISPTTNTREEEKDFPNDFSRESLLFFQEEYI
jgi:hypothetical protein